ncbi:17.6 kDa class I heat shock protein 3 [Forsythia ovata]|uniref:17.6 kDa class I heat shock protein 3 n=1 Tax=Forsythia ovata TaxID=205694 RepID=A0ABD1UE10_9LAMI
MSVISNLFTNTDPFISLMNMCPVLSTPIDWKETPEAHIFMADLPGLSKEDVKVEVSHGRILQISGERKSVEDSDQNTLKWHCVERNRARSFFRQFRLPENAKVDQLNASVDNGVLTVTVPKQEVKVPMTKVIEIEEK